MMGRRHGELDLIESGSMLLIPNHALKTPARGPQIGDRGRPQRFTAPDA